MLSTKFEFTLMWRFSSRYHQLASPQHSTIYHPWLHLRPPPTSDVSWFCQVRVSGWGKKFIIFISNCAMCSYIFDFLCWESSRQILFVCQHQKSCTSKSLFEKQNVQLFPTRIQSHTISWIDDPHETVSAFKVISPVGSQGLLTTNIP